MNCYPYSKMQRKGLGTEMKRKTDAAVSEAVSYIFQSGYFGRSEYIIPREMQLSIEEPEAAFGNTDGFDNESYFLRMRSLPCFDGMEEGAVREILSRRAFHISCGKSDVTLAALESVYELRQKYGIRKFILMTSGAAERERLCRTISVMRDYFSDKYYGLKLDILTYDSNDLRQIRAFALSDDIQLLIVNKEYFIRSNNLMKRASSRLEGLTPVSMIRPARCVALTISESIHEITAVLKHAEVFNPLCTISFTESGRELPGVPLVDINELNRQAQNQAETGSTDTDDLQLII